MKKNYLRTAVIALTAGLMLASCNDEPNNGGDDDSGTATGTGTAYVITAEVDDANYIVSTGDLTKGSTNTVGIGTETDTGTYWVYYEDKYLYRLNYNQGDAGITASYRLNNQDKAVARSNTYEVKRFTSYGFYDHYLITTSTGSLADSHAETISGEGYIPKGFLINYINVEEETIRPNSEEIWSEDYFGDGEFVTFAGVLQVGDKIFTAPVPMGMSHYGVKVYEDKIKYPELVKTDKGGSGSSAYTPGELQWTQYPDQAYIAIYPNMNFRDDEKKLIKTELISYACGRSASQYYQMIWAADNGDVYVFSPSYAKRMTDEVQRTTLDAGVLRIKSGTEEFDPDYYVNIEKITGGKSFLRSWHVAEDYFMLLMYDAPLDPDVSANANDLAIFKGESGELTYVTGMPDNIASIGTMPYFEDGIAYIPVKEEGDEDPAVYMINAAAATASKGISVSAETIKSVGKLTYRQ